MTLILVKGVRPDGNSGGFIASALPEGGLDPFPSLSPSDGEGGGPSGAPGRYEFLHTITCNSADGAAAQVAETIMATDDVHPQVFTWKTAEYGTIIVENAIGVFSAYNNAVYSDGTVNTTRIPLPENPLLIIGYAHNHPEANLSDEIRKQNRYPSDRDWDIADDLKQRFAITHPTFNPVIWITDWQGQTRRFIASEKDYIKGLSSAAMEDGVGLDGRLVENTCS